MADAPKEEKKGLTLFEEVMILLFVLFALGSILWRANVFFAYYYGSSLGSVWDAFHAYFFARFLPAFRIVSFLASAFAVWGIVTAFAKLRAIEKAEKEIYGAKLPVEDEAAPLFKNEKWERVLSHINSANASDWRLAIIEADVMLDDLLKTLGLPGDSLGERLKAVEKSDMLTLDYAWEAHRVRNQIAHAGSDYPLSEREARRAVTLYESVFREYKII